MKTYNVNQFIIGLPGDDSVGMANLSSVFALPDEVFLDENEMSDALCNLTAFLQTLYGDDVSVTTPELHQEELEGERLADASIVEFEVLNDYYVQFNDDGSITRMKIEAEYDFVTDDFAFDAARECK